jgi:hypothetical protein
MGALESAISKGADQLIATWGPPAFFILLLIAVVIYLWFEVKNERKLNADLHKQINVEIKAGVAMAQEFRKTFDDGMEALRDRRRAE